jgi:hypothetical protein
MFTASVCLVYISLLRVGKHYPQEICTRSIKVHDVHNIYLMLICIDHFAEYSFMDLELFQRGNDYLIRERVTGRLGSILKQSQLISAKNLKTELE